MRFINIIQKFYLKNLIPNLKKLYLPDAYEGNPLLKSFELISREVKPWPGEVDVEGMPEDNIVVSDEGS